MSARIANHSSVALWVVESGKPSKRPTAHLLQPGKETPKGVKVLGIQAADGQALLLQSPDEARLGIPPRQSIPAGYWWRMPADASGRLTVQGQGTPQSPLIMPLPKRDTIWYAMARETDFSKLRDKPLYLTDETGWGTPSGPGTQTPPGPGTETPPKPPPKPPVPSANSPWAVKELVRAVTAAKDDAERFRALLALMNVLHIGVFESSGKPLIRGAEKSVRDFYLYDFELRIIAAAFARQDRWTLTEFVQMLANAGLIGEGTGLVREQAICEGLLEDIETALSNPDAPSSAVPLLIRELGLRHGTPVDLAQRPPAAKVKFDALQHFLFTSALLFSLREAVEVLGASTPEGQSTNMGTLQGVLTAEQPATRPWWSLTDPAPAETPPWWWPTDPLPPMTVSEWGDLCSELRAHGRWPRRLVQGAAVKGIVNRLISLGSAEGAAWAAALGARLMAEVIIDALHGMVLAYCIKVTMDPDSGNYCHYGPAGHYHLAGKPFQFVLRVTMQDDLTDIVVKCGWLLGVIFPPAGPVKRIDVTWFPRNLGAHGTITYDPAAPQIITNDRGECVLLFQPKDEASPYAGDLTLDTGVVIALPNYLSSLGNWTVGNVAQYLTPKLGMGGWTIEWHKQSALGIGGSNPPRTDN